MAYAFDVRKTSNDSWTSETLHASTVISNGATSTSTALNIIGGRQLTALHLFISLDSGTPNMDITVQGSSDGITWGNHADGAVTVTSVPHYMVVNDPPKHVRLSTTNNDISSITMTVAAGYYSS